MIVHNYIKFKKYLDNSAVFYNSAKGKINKFLFYCLTNGYTKNLNLILYIQPDNMTI